MTSRPRFALSTSPLALILSLVIAIPTLAFEYPLSTTAIREAYMLGTRKDFKTAEFFEPYTHYFSKPDKGPQIATIGIETPLGQVVEMGQADLNSDTQGAEQDLAGKDFPFFVLVGVNLTDTYPGPPPSNPRGFAWPMPDFKRDFEIRVSQDKHIFPNSTQVYFFYSDAVANIFGISGALIELKFDVEKIDPGEDLVVQVHTPDDQTIETIFSLGSLR
jgi:hypothetical protein